MIRGVLEPIRLLRLFRPPPWLPEPGERVVCTQRVSDQFHVGGGYVVSQVVMARVECANCKRRGCGFLYVERDDSGARNGWSLCMFIKSAGSGAR